jgi:hypothetical protein
MNHWDRDIIKEHLKKLKIDYLPHQNESKEILKDLFDMQEKYFESMEKKHF